jgi:hypothetical protein
MTTLYLAMNGSTVVISTCLDEVERTKIGDVLLELYPGEAFGGLSFNVLAALATVVGQVDSNSLTG